MFAMSYERVCSFHVCVNCNQLTVHALAIMKKGDAKIHFNAEVWVKLRIGKPFFLELLLLIEYNIIVSYTLILADALIGAFKPSSDSNSANMCDPED